MPPDNADLEIQPDDDISIDDLRIRGIRPLMPAACLIEGMHGDETFYSRISCARQSISNAVKGEDDRLVVIVGPAAIHDPSSALEFAARLQQASETHVQDLLLVFRAPLDKPTGSHSQTPWAGLINDPDLDGSYQINKGLSQARKLLVDINTLGLPTATEYVDTISPQFVADLVSWSSVGPRDSNNKLLRELASGLSTPVGFHNDNSGDWKVAVEAVAAGNGAHAFLSVSKQGNAGIVETSGNSECHVVLQGGASGPGYSKKHIASVSQALRDANLPSRVMVDCGSFNSNASPSAQAAVAADVAATVAGGDTSIFGVLLHSFLLSGKQDLAPGVKPVYGISSSEPCMDWTATLECLNTLAAAVRSRREAVRASASPASLAKRDSLRRAFVEVGSISALDNLRVRNIRPLISPACVIEEIPADAEIAQLVLASRCDVSAALHESFGRLVVVIGPSAVHDARAAMEYAARLRAKAAEHEEELLVIMACNFETGSAVSGWKGMMNDPDVDGSYQINKGLRQARKLLVDINTLGLPTATEYVDTISPQFVADLVSWASVGPYTESEAHRELASGLSTPVGFRNAGSGDWKVAVEAVGAASAPHAFLSVSKQGIAGIVETTGNRDCHVVLHGGASGANHGRAAVESVTEALSGLGLPSRVMVDCDSFNSGGSPTAQARVAAEVAALVASGDESVFGVQLRSNLLSGKQELVVGSKRTPVYGLSVTEPCMDWSTTSEVLETLAAAVRRRRREQAKQPAKKARTA